VRREDAAAGDRLHVPDARLPVGAPGELAIEQVQAEEGRVALVDVVLRPGVEAEPELLEEHGAADPEHDLLTEAVARVAAVQRVGERPVVRVVLGRSVSSR
jgi:hypothetical protein